MKARLALSVVLASAVCVPAALGSHVAVPAAPHRAAAGVLFDDEFNGPAGSSPDSSWLQLTGYGPFSSSDESNTTSRSNSYLDGAGDLVIAAQRTSVLGQDRYTSAWLVSGAAFGPYMHVEARMKIAGGLGTWPLFWLLGGDPYGLEWPRKGEIDVGEEIGKEPTSFIATLHGYTTNPAHYKHANGQVQHEWEDSTHIDVRKVLADGFHTYATDITPDQVTWYLDGAVVKVYKRSQLQSGDVWSFTYPMHVILNLSIGGFFAGPVPTDVSFPQTTIVDYVRITDDPQAPSGTPAPRPPSSSDCDPTTHGLLRVTVTKAKGATSSGGTIVLKRSGKVVQRNKFSYRTPVGFCAKPGATQVVASTKNGSKSKSVTVRTKSTTMVSFTLR